MGGYFSQLRAPAPLLTERNLGSQHGKVVVITGGTSELALELATMLFYAGAKVYITARDEVQAREAIDDIKNLHPAATSFGKLDYLVLDLSDLSSIPASVRAFLAKESKLHLLYHTPGVAVMPAGMLSAQRLDIHMATNTLGPYLLTQLLYPMMRSTALSVPPAKVRVMWAGSPFMDSRAPRGGMDLSTLSRPSHDSRRNHTAASVGNYFLASEYAREVSSQGILSVAVNAGHLKTDARQRRHTSSFLHFCTLPFTKAAKMGAYAELWAGLSEDLTMEQSGAYIVPWGRVHARTRRDLQLACESERDGGTGVAARFRLWCDAQVASYLDQSKMYPYGLR